MQHPESISREAWAHPAAQKIQMIQDSHPSDDYDNHTSNHSIACKRRLLQLPPMHMSAYFTLDTSTLLVNNIQDELEHLKSGSTVDGGAEQEEGVGGNAARSHPMMQAPSGCWWILWWYMSSPPGTINCAPCCAACWTPCCPCCKEASILTHL